jgi:ubiquitin-conjugating enzyme E2 J1
MQGGEALSAIGALDYSKDERKRLAKLYVDSPAEDSCLIRCCSSREWLCPTCGVRNLENLPDKPAGVVKTASESVEVERVVELGEEAASRDFQHVQEVPPNFEEETPNPPPLPTLDQPVSHPMNPSHPSITSVAPTPTTTSNVSSLSPPPTRPPVWLDTAIFFCIAILLALIARRMV